MIGKPRQPLVMVIAAVVLIVIGVVGLLMTWQQPRQRDMKQSDSLNQPLAVKTGNLPTVQQVEPVVIRVFGDVMLGRNVEAKTTKYGLSYPYEKIRSELFTSADILVANLEGPVPQVHTPTPTGSTRFSFTPDMIQALGKEGFDIVSLANNHTFDHGSQDFKNTQDQVRAAGMQPLGNPNTETDTNIVRTTQRGQDFIFVGFNAFRPDFDLATAAATIRTTHAAAPDVPILVMIHWGTEYVLTHNAQQKKIGHALIDAGADIILGQHPHVTQDIEKYKGKLIFYSLGNFIFDQYFSQDTQESLGIELEYRDGLQNVRIYPLVSVASQPQLMSKEKRKAFLQSLADRSNAEIQSQVADGFISFAQLN